MIPRRRRNSLRAPRWNYRSPGAYFITICVAGRAPVLAQVIQSGVRLTRLGRLVLEEWAGLPRWISTIAVDSLVVMPDHLHAIVWVVASAGRAGLPARAGPRSGSVGAVVGQIKSRVTKAAHSAGLWPMGMPLWQRGYHDRILPSEQAVVCARAYIDMNPIRWARDHARPVRAGGRGPRRG